MPLPYQAEARAALGDELFRYLLGRSQDGQPEDGNEAAFRRYALVPRLLTGTTGIDTETGFLGQKIAAPLVIGAFAGDRLFHPEGLLPVARVCARLRLPLVVSEETVTPLPSITACHRMVFLQLRAAGPLERVRSLMQQAADAGAAGIVLTVLAPVHPVQGMQPGGFNVGQTLREKGWSTIGSDGPGAHPLPAFPQWGFAEVAAMVEAAKSLGLPVILKGILHPGDVLPCEQTGASAIAVSNIGLRQSGRWLTALDALPAIRKAATENTIIMLDGGVRHGSDILTARLLGADVAVVSRPVLSALAGGGEAGVEHYLRGLVDAVTALTTWMGARNPDGLSADQLVRIGAADPDTGADHD